MRTYDNIKKTATGREDYYTTSSLLDYPNFKENYKLIATQRTHHVKLIRWRYYVDTLKGKHRQVST